MDASNLSMNEMLVVLDATRRLTEQRLLQPMMRYVAQTVFEIINADRCMIVLFAEDGSPQVQVDRDRNGRDLELPIDPASRSILEQVRSSMNPLRVDRAIASGMLPPAPSPSEPSPRSVFCVPLILYGQASGAIYVESCSNCDRFQNTSPVPLMLFSYQVATAVESARQNELLEARIAERTRELEAVNARLADHAAYLHEQSIRDNLTGLFNRRYFDANLSQLFAMALRYTRPLTLAVLDLDNFKQINDTYFHATGDAVLRATASLFEQNIRRSDTVARVGGEEFAILMPHTMLSDAAQVCERLRTIVETHNWGAIAPGLRVTVSIGLAEHTGCADERAQMTLADRRLYQAKHLGRNRVVAAEG